jgi:YD repeat-containing protein
LRVRKSSLSPFPFSTTTVYDGTARTLTTTSPAGRQSVTTLDANGRIVQIQFGTLTPVQFTYDDRGRVAAVTIGTGQDARLTTYTYDADGWLSSITDALGRVFGFEHDPAGRLLLVGGCPPLGSDLWKFPKLLDNRPVAASFARLAR